MLLLDLALHSTIADKQRIYAYLLSSCRGRGGWVDQKLHNPLCQQEEMLKIQTLSPGDPPIVLVVGKISTHHHLTVNCIQGGRRLRCFGDCCLL